MANGLTAVDQSSLATRDDVASFSFLFVNLDHPQFVLDTCGKARTAPAIP